MTYRNKLNELREISNEEIKLMFDEITMKKVTSIDFDSEITKDEEDFLVLNEMINRLRTDKGLNYPVLKDEDF